MMKSVRKIRMPLTLINTTVYQSTMNKLCGPSHSWVVGLKTDTLDPAGNRCRMADYYSALVPPTCSIPYGSRLLYLYFSTSPIAESTYFSLSIWVEVTGVRAGRGIYPNTNSVGHKPSGPTVELTGRTPILGKSRPAVIFNRSVLNFS